MSERGYEIEELLDRMREAVANALRFAASTTRSDFVDDTLRQYAIVRALEIVGEAARNISRDHSQFAVRYPQIPWRDLVAMRNVPAHGYAGVDYELVWDVVATRLPPLLTDIEALMLELGIEPEGPSS